MTQSGEGQPPTSPLPRVGSTPETAPSPTTTSIPLAAATPPATGSAAPPAANKHRTRRALAATLVVIGAILGPVAVTGLWARALINNTETYLDAVGPLATDPAVTAALEDRITDAVMNGVDSLDVSGQVQDFLTARGMPNRLASLLSSAIAGLNSNLRAMVSDTVSTVIETPAFGTAWTGVNRTAHQALVKVVNGDSRLLDEQGNLSLQLQPVIDLVKQRLIDNGHSWARLLPSDLTATWVLVPAEQVATLQNAVGTLRTIAIVLVIVELVVIAGAILLAPDRMRGLTWMALGLAAGSTVMLGVLRYGERVLVGDYPQLRHPDAITAMIQTVAGTLVNWLRLMFLIGLAVTIVAALLGRGRQARRIRAGLASFRTAMTHPPYSGPRRVVAAAVALGCALTLVFVSDPSAFAVGALLFGVLLGAVLALIPSAVDELAQPDAATAGGTDQG